MTSENLVAEGDVVSQETEEQTDLQTIDDEVIDKHLERMFASEDAYEKLTQYPEFNKAQQRAVNKAAKKAEKEFEEKTHEAAKQKVEDQVYRNYFQTVARSNPAAWQQMQHDPEWSRKIREVTLRGQGIDPKSYTQTEAMKDIAKGMEDHYRGDDRFDGLDWEEVAKSSATEIPFILAEYLTEKATKRIERELRKVMTEEVKATVGEELTKLHGNAPQPSQPPGPSSVSVNKMTDKEILGEYGRGSDNPHIIARAKKLLPPL